MKEYLTNTTFGEFFSYRKEEGMVTRRIYESDRKRSIAERVKKKISYT